MDIRILDSWLREYLDMDASPKEFAEKMSLASVGIEKIEEVGNDFIYNIEVTTNRPELMSVVGLAQEASAVLPQAGLSATFKKPIIKKPHTEDKESIEIVNDPKLVNRICAAILEVKQKQTPDYIKKRLEAAGIRTLNNLVDVTNYIMREMGHPAHVFDFDRLTTKKLIIRESKKGEKIVTLDKVEHILSGGDIVADNGEAEIVDLLGIMGTDNSVVTDTTTRILFFLDNNEPHHMRKTSMSLGIRSEAAILNEKGIDPELTLATLLRGIELYEQIADGRVISKIIDIYPNKVKEKTITTTQKKINDVAGVSIPLATSAIILNALGFKTTIVNHTLSAVVPSFRNNDMDIEEDLIEEITRVYGYYKLPSIIPPFETNASYSISDDIFYWENRTKNALKYWGFTEVYTSSLVSEELFEGPVEDAVTIANPLSSDLVYLRKTLVPNLLTVLSENKNRHEIKLFELSKIYIRKANSLPDEIQILAAVIKKSALSFFEIKGVVEQLLTDLGVTMYVFKPTEIGNGAEVYIQKDHLGSIELLDDQTGTVELNFDILLDYVSLKKIYRPIPKFPPIIEDVRIIVDQSITYEKIVSTIKKQSQLVKSITLLDTYQDKKTFRIMYQDPNRNLTNEEVSEIRQKIYSSLEKDLHAKIS